MITLDCISDTHGSHYDLKLPGGDILLVAGDVTSNGGIESLWDFEEWLGSQPYQYTAYTGGNHDAILTKKCGGLNCQLDEMQEIMGLKIWFSPWSLYFLGVKPEYSHFMGNEFSLKNQYDMIPDGVDIIVSHTPPYGILDDVRGYSCGSKSLYETLCRVRPRALICGHLHANGGKMMRLKHFNHDDTMCYNVSVLNEDYEVVNAPTRITL